MEFGIFVQGYTPGFRQEADPEAEHHALMNELELVKAADTAGFKYVWVTEHHFLHEFSHLSANEVFLGHLQPAPPGEPPGQGGGEGGDARPPLGWAGRVRHGARRGQPRDPRVPPR